MELLKIDLDRVIRSRAGKRGKYIPRFLTRMLEKIIHQEELNDVLEKTYPAEGTAFCEAVYRYFGLELEVEGLENIPAGRRLLFACNHPLGGLDGIGIIKVLGGIYGDDRIRFLVNDMLMNVEPLRNVFLPVNKYGAQGRAAAAAINEAYASDAQIIIFPAGLVSRLHDDGRIRDLQWQKSFVSKALQYDRDILPVRFEGLNRRRFYRLARLRRKLGIGFNIEQAFLPGEVCASRGKKFRIVIGKPIDGETLRSFGDDPAAIAARLREELYAL